MPQTQFRSFHRDVEGEVDHSSFLHRGNCLKGQVLSGFAEDDLEDFVDGDIGND